MPLSSSRRILSLVVLCLVLSGISPISLLAQEANPGVQVDGVTVLDPDEEYAGVSRGEWDTRLWQASVSLPEAVNPSFNPAGAGCGYGQSGPVFLLPSNFTPEPITMTCVVPEGMAIFVVVGGSECSTVEPHPFFGRNEEELRACAAAFTDTITDLEATINGEAVPDLEAYRTSSPLFTMTFGEDNFFGVPPGVAHSVADSYNFIVVPPPPGEYEITVSATFPDGETLTTTTRVIVEAPQVIEPEASPEATPVT